MRCDIGDIVSFNFNYNGHPPGTLFVVDQLGWCDDTVINGIPAVLYFHAKPIPPEMAVGVSPAEGAD
jgi:hypothetical protein